MDAVKPIAVIGMACRLPGGISNPEDLWEACCQRRSGWSEIPRSRFNHESFYHPDHDRPGSVSVETAPAITHFVTDTSTSTILKGRISCKTISLFSTLHSSGSLRERQRLVVWVLCGDFLIRFVIGYGSSAANLARVCLWGSRELSALFFGPLAILEADFSI